MPQPSEAGKALIARVDDFIADAVEPEQAALAEVYATNPDGLDLEGRKLPEVVAARNRIFKSSAENGFLSAHLPAEVGGGGLSHVDIYFLREAVFKHGLGLNQYVVNMTSRGPNVMLLEVQDSVKDRYMYPVIRGERTTCFALTERGAGSDAIAIETRADRDGDDWIINGRKRFIGNGPYADFAQVVARTTDIEDRRGDGISIFAVDMVAPGISNIMVRTMVASGDWSEITFENVRVPAQNLIGEQDKGLRLLMKWLIGERIDMCGQCLGLAQYLVDLAVDYAKTRTTFGKPLGSRQYIQGMITDSATEIFAAKHAALEAAARRDAGERVRKEASMAKILATETLYRVADRTIQVFGGHGLDKALPVEKVYRLARAMTVYEGTTEINKLTIAKELGLPMD